MDDIWIRLVEHMSDRVTGPMKFRLILQPAMASIFAIIAGLNDAKLGNPPYFWSLFTNSGHRAEMLRDGWKSVGKVFVLAMVLDLVFQIRVLNTVYPGEVIIVAFLLAILPYLLLRGLVTRLMQRRSA
jgi:hypothetical protein